MYWRERFEHGPRPRFTTTEIIPDADVMAIVSASAAVLNLTMPQALEAFGEHWSTKYAPSIYGVYFDKAKSTRELLVSLDHVHVVMTKAAGAQPPRFTYKWTSDLDLVMTYSSSRPRLAMMPGRVRGVAKYYKGKVDVHLVGDDVMIRFAA